MTIWHMCFVCCVTKATNTHSECVIVIALPPQQSLHYSHSILLFTNVACLADLSNASAPALSPSNLNHPLNENRHIFHRR